MRKLILLLAVLIISSTGFAQDLAKKGEKGGAKKTPEQRAQKSSDNLDKIVTLTPDQKNQVYNLALTRAQKVDGIRESYKGKPDQKEAMRKEIKTAHKDYRIAVKPLLTPEQIEKLKAHHKAKKANKGQKTKYPKIKAGADTSAEPAITEQDVEDAIPSEE